MRRMPVLSVIMVIICSASILVAQLLNTSDTLICRDDGTIEPFDQLLLDSITADPIAAVGHGAILNAEGEEIIDVTPEFILEAQRFYLRSLFHQADETQRAEFKAKQKRLMQGTKCDEQGLVDVNFALIDWLIDEVQPENASRLASINTFLHAKFATIIDSLLPGQGAATTRMLETLTQEGMQRAATELSGPAYIAECASVGVPRPPDPLPTDWPSTPPDPGTTIAVGPWQYRGPLTTKFISRSIDAHVFTFESSSPRGICFALPRSSGNNIALLSIMCQGSDTSKVCFWDNQENDRNFPIPKGTVKRLSEFAGGAELYAGTGGVCTDCHAGENPFIVHPGTPLDLHPTPKPNNWYDPLVHALWPQNPGPTHLLDNIPPVGGCLSCHTQSNAGRFPEVSKELGQYCNDIFEAAVGNRPPIPPTMPIFPSHIDALRTACAKSKGELASDVITICPDDPTLNRCILKGNSPAESFTPCFGADGECPRKKTLTFTLPEAAEVFIRYDLGQSHGCCDDHRVGVLRILLNGTEVHRDRIPFLNYGVQPISQFLEDFDYFFSDNVVEGFVRPVSQVDPRRVGPRLENYKVVNKLLLGNLAAGSHTVELQVGDAGWNSTFVIFR